MDNNVKLVTERVEENSEWIKPTIELIDIEIVVSELDIDIAYASSSCGSTADQCPTC